MMYIPPSRSRSRALIANLKVLVVLAVIKGQFEYILDWRNLPLNRCRKLNFLHLESIGLYVFPVLFPLSISPSFLTLVKSLYTSVILTAIFISIISTTIGKEILHLISKRPCFFFSGHDGLGFKV